MDDSDRGGFGLDHILIIYSLVIILILIIILDYTYILGIDYIFTNCQDGNED